MKSKDTCLYSTYMFGQHTALCLIRICDINFGKSCKFFCGTFPTPPGQTLARGKSLYFYKI